MTKGAHSKVAKERLISHEAKFNEITENLAQNIDGVNQKFGAVDNRLERIEQSLEEIRVLLEGFQPPKQSAESGVTVNHKGMSHMDTSELSSANQPHITSILTSGTSSPIPLTMPTSAPHTIMHPHNIHVPPITQSQIPDFVNTSAHTNTIPTNQEHNPFDHLSNDLNQLNLNSDQSNIINFDAYEDIPVETTGSDIPPPVNTFAEIRLGKALDDNIRRCKYVKPTPIQRHAIPVALAGRDLMACAQTGSGKTAAFCFPIISGILKQNGTTGFGAGQRMRVACPLALIMSPTRELSCQIHEEAKKFSHQTGVKVVVAYGGAPINRQSQNLKKGVDILVATPGRLVDMIERERISLERIKYLVLDEADRMLDMGFEPQIRQIVQEMGMPLPGARQTLLFSATFPTEIQRLASDFLSNYIFLSVGRVGSSTDLIDQRVELVQDMDKRSRLMNILKDQRTNGMAGKLALTLVFVETKRGADALEQWLCRSGFLATAIHGDKVQMERERALRSFKTGAAPILVATDVAARGLDVPHVTHVINFDLPKDIDDYVHRIGRTGRAGKSGLATAFFSEKNSPLAKALAHLMQESNQQVPSWLTQYAETSSSYGNGRSKFGGHDFRSSSNNGGDSGYDDYNASNSGYNDYNASTGPADYPNFDYSGTNPGDSTYSDYSGNDFAAAVGGVDTYAGGAPEYQSIVPTGWD